MLEHTQKLTTKGDAEINVRFPAARVDAVKETISKILDLAGIKYRIKIKASDLEEAKPWREVYPDTHPGEILRGARYREELTQAKLAEKIGVKRQHISEMENNKRPIGKAMAKRLAKALNVNYKIFL